MCSRILLHVQEANLFVLKHNSAVHIRGQSTLRQRCRSGDRFAIVDQRAAEVDPQRGIDRAHYASARAVRGNACAGSVNHDAAVQPFVLGASAHGSAPEQAALIATDLDASLLQHRPQLATTTIKPPCDPAVPTDIPGHNPLRSHGVFQAFPHPRRTPR